MKSLKVFIHIPKTGGSTVNAALHASGMKGYSHIETVVNDAGILAQTLQDADWLSGHIGILTAGKQLSWATSRKIRYFSCMREPRHQVMSHLNWVMKVCRQPKGVLQSTSEEILEISYRINSIGINTKYDVMYALLRNRGLFLNVQRKMILGDQPIPAASLVDNFLSKYDYIGITENMGGMLSAIGVEASNNLVRTNVSEYLFDTSLFDDPDIVDFLSIHNDLDMMLYDAVKRRFKHG